MHKKKNWKSLKILTDQRHWHIIPLISLRRDSPETDEVPEPTHGGATIEIHKKGQSVYRLDSLLLTF
jgi:hypothetical protein